MTAIARHSLRAAVSALAIAMAGCCPKPPTLAPTATPNGPAEPTPIGPTADGADADKELIFPDQEFRKRQPEAAEPRPFRLPAAATFALDNGIQVYSVARHDLPVISLRLEFDGGSMNDPKGKEGLAGICMRMLTEGTKDLEKLAYKEALADIASGISSSAGDDTQSVSMYTLGKHLDATFALYLDSLLRPGLRKTDFDRMVERQLESLKQQKGSAGPVVARLYQNVLFGPKHPFGRLVTEKSLRAIKLKDCARYHKAYLRPKGARLFVFGDLTEAQIRERFGAPLARWTGKPKRSVRLPAPRTRKGKVFFVDVPGSAQSVVYLMHFAPGRNAPDHVANEMMAAVLGSGFGSRINMNLREDKGYTYGASGGFDYTRDYGSFFAGGSVDGKATLQSVQEIHKEMRDLRGVADQAPARPATAAELARDKNGAILSLPADFATGRQVLSKYRDLVYFGLPLDYYATYVDKLTAVDLEQVNASAKKHLRPDDVTVLVVGDGKTALIERKDGKDVAMLDAAGKPVSLIDGLRQLAESGQLGKGALVVLDADGRVYR